VVGTIDYVAPEQIQGSALDARTDVYALGCVLHQALTGQVPYLRDSDVAKMYAHLSEPPPSATAVAPGVPAELDQVIGRAMAKDVEGRYPSAGDLGRAALAAVERRAPVEPERSVARGEAAPATVPAPAPPPTVHAAPPPTAPQPPVYQPPPPPSPPPPSYPASTQVLPAPRRGRGVAIGVAAALLGAALLTGGLFAAGVFDKGSSKPAAKTTTTNGKTNTETTATTSTADYATYSTGAYTADYPAGWRITEDNVLHTTYTQTTFEAPDGSASVLIDRSPGQDASPQASAEDVEKQTAAKTADYQRLSFESTTLNGKDAFEWTFQEGSTRKIDIFLVEGGDGYAVLGKGAPFDSVISMTRHVAGSIEPSG
jgi:serine/threonine protein kinase